MSRVAFEQPGLYGGFREPSSDPLRGEVPPSQRRESEDDQNSSFKKDRCGCYVDDKKSKELLADYLESASIHGVAQTKGPQFYSWRRPVWLMLILIMAVALSWTLYRQISTLYQHPIKTVTKMTINSELPFPAVTICNLNQYVKKRLPTDDPMIETMLYAQSQYATMSQNLDADHHLAHLSNLTDIPGKKLRKIVRRAAPRLDEMLLLCSWGGNMYPCSDLFRPIHTGYGTCYVFNGPEIATENLAKAVSLFSQLRVMVSIQNSQSYYSKLIHAGIKVIVHQKDEMPFPLFQGWYIRPGVAAAMDLTRSDSKCLPYPFKAFSNGYCEDTKADGYINRLTRYPIYNANNCLNDCMFGKLEEECGCRHYFANGNHSVCSAKEILKCYMPNLAHLNADDSKFCGCQRECESVTYSADMSYADFATRFIEKQSVQDGLTYAKKHLEGNIIDLRVSFKTLNVMEIIQEPEMSVWTVIGSLGGQLGLFLGASALSFVELIEILLLIFVTSLRKAFHTVLGRHRKASVSV